MGETGWREERQNERLSRAEAVRLSTDRPPPRGVHQGVSIQPHHSFQEGRLERGAPFAIWKMVSSGLGRPV